MQLISDLHRLHRGQPPRRMSRQARSYVEARRDWIVCPHCGEPLRGQRAAAGPPQTALDGRRQVSLATGDLSVLDKAQ